MKDRIEAVIKNGKAICINQNGELYHSSEPIEQGERAIILPLVIMIKKGFKIIRSYSLVGKNFTTRELI